MPGSYNITELFGANLAEILSEKIEHVYPNFQRHSFIERIGKNCIKKTYTERIDLIADELHRSLPADFSQTIPLLTAILGPENPNEDGMFKHFYWVLPIGKYVQKYGLEHFDLSMKAISEITKRNTGEYAIRPFVKKYPEATLKIMHKWAQSKNFHLRRLASEGLRPKLPWAPKLEIYIDDPSPIFEILEILKEDSSKFVQRSLANHLTDYLKVNYPAARRQLLIWSRSNHPTTKWIVRHATRKIAL